MWDFADKTTTVTTVPKRCMYTTPPPCPKRTVPKPTRRELIPKLRKTFKTPLLQPFALPSGTYTQRAGNSCSCSPSLRRQGLGLNPGILISEKYHPMWPSLWRLVFLGICCNFLYLSFKTLREEINKEENSFQQLI